jgi:outer membrane lipoprotein-sorting protein
VRPADIRPRRGLVLMLGAVLLAGTSVGRAAEWQLSELMQLLAQTKSGQARFVERKYIAMLDKPVESSGELFFSAPDRMEMRTLKPKKQAMLLDGNRLTLEQEGRQKTVSLQSYPEVAAFVEGIRGTLAGDRQALEKVYKVHLIGNPARWQLMLVPREPSMSRIISGIRIGGSQGEVLSVAYDHADGDRSEMQITPVTRP